MNSTDSQTDLSRAGVVEICGTLRLLLADIFVLYVKTKNFHWHLTGSHFRDYHLLLDVPERRSSREGVGSQEFRVGHPGRRADHFAHEVVVPAA